ncbi:MAG: methyl-accepting chemotaxis protein, partial [Oscillospiraceae bacterium]
AALVQISEGVEQISAVVQTNSATAEESAAASEELSGQANMLNNVLSKLKLKNIEQGKASDFIAAAPSKKSKSPSQYDFSFSSEDKY